MRCHVCLKPIQRGAEEAKRIETRSVPQMPPTAASAGVSLSVHFGEGMKAGTLADGSMWPLEYAEHSKCYHARTRREQRQARITADRAADPGHQEHEDRDWRDPRTLEIEDMLTDGRDNDGVGGR